LNTPVDAGIRDRALAALEEITDAARRAGEVALQDFRWGGRTSAQVHTKYGGSPVTTADLAVDRYLRERLGAAFPGDGWLSEETADDLSRLEMANLIVVDPIDGTRAFLTGDPRWAVSIAYIHDGRPIAGVIHAPALGQTYQAAVGCGAKRNDAPIHASRRSALGSALVGGPRSMVAALAKAADVQLAAAPRIPSLALRMAQVADGGLDVGLASTSASDWDVAGADVILSEAGALLTDVRGQILHYNRQSMRHGVLLACGADLVRTVVKAARAAFGDGAA
jgi:myo-inositol-1(or 4)-monophosphatase